MPAGSSRSGLHCPPKGWGNGEAVMSWQQLFACWGVLHVVHHWGKGSQVMVDTVRPCPRLQVLSRSATRLGMSGTVQSQVHHCTTAQQCLLCSGTYWARYKGSPSFPVPQNCHGKARGRPAVGQAGRTKSVCKAIHASVVGSAAVCCLSGADKG